MKKLPQSFTCSLKSVSDAFTLIELLVATTIIAILLLLTVPAVNGVRAASQDATCVSNLRQIGASAMLYSQDHGNRTLPGNFYSALTNAGYLPRQTYGDLLSRDGIWMCPHDTKDRSSVLPEKAASILNISYGYNAQRIGLPPTYWSTSKITVNQITDPANTIYISDSKSYYFNRGNKNIMFRHSDDEEVHAVFFDCHVDAIKKPEDLTEFYYKYL